MRSTRSVRVLAVLALSLGLLACGGGDDDDDGDGSGTTDAAVDGASSPDASPDAATLTGLGQACVPAMQGADCPASAPGCLSSQGAATGFCTKLCVQTVTFMTDAQNQPGPFTPDPATQDAMCTAIFTGAVGTAECSVPVNITPALPLQPNTNYTASFACGIACGAGNACPGSLTCNTQIMQCR